MNEKRGVDEEILFRLRLEDLLKAYLRALDVEFSFAVRTSLSVKDLRQKKYWATALMRLTVMRSAAENDLATISRLTGSDFEALASSHMPREITVVTQKELLPALIMKKDEGYPKKVPWWRRNFSKFFSLHYSGKKT